MIQLADTLCKRLHMYIYKFMYHLFSCFLNRCCSRFHLNVIDENSKCVSPHIVTYTKKTSVCYLDLLFSMQTCVYVWVIVCVYSLLMNDKLFIKKERKNVYMQIEIANKIDNLKLTTHMYLFAFICRSLWPNIVSWIHF